MLRLDKDINSLRSFASRAYSHEMTIQKTVLRDQLGGKYPVVRERPSLHEAPN